MPPKIICCDKVATTQYFFQKILCCSKKNKVADTCHHMNAFALLIFGLLNTTRWRMDSSTDNLLSGYIRIINYPDISGYPWTSLVVNPWLPSRDHDSRVHLLMAGGVYGSPTYRETRPILIVTNRKTIRTLLLRPLERPLCATFKVSENAK